jgi:predicted metal-dependent hydrolase
MPLHKKLPAQAGQTENDPLAPPGYRLIRSKRKTLALEVHPGREVLVRAPMKMPQKEIDAFLSARKDWVYTHWRKPARARVDYSKEEERLLRLKARELLPGLIQRYGTKLGVNAGRITITGARTRFGSCSAKGSVCFSFRLMAYPLESVEYVVLHELAHLKHLNHSPAFYKLVESLMPDWKERAKMLKLAPAGAENIPEG